MENFYHSAVILFLKYPEKGKVKTRLSKEIGDENTLELYKSFVIDTIDKLIGIKAHIFIYLTPEERINDFNNWLSIPELWEIRGQRGTDLGEKMNNAFKEVFNSGYAHCLIMGSDLPDLPRGYIQDAILNLKQHNVVLGPANDGGYYLIGFQKQFYKEAVFKGIEWGTGSVYESTIEILEKYNLMIKRLNIWQDIDIYEDLLSFNSRMKKTLNLKEGLETKKKLEEIL